LAAQAETRLLLKQGDEAVKVAERIVKAQKEAPDAYVFLGGIQERAGRSQDAARSYQKAMEKQANHLGAALSLAALHDREKRPQAAAKLLREAADSHPQEALPLVHLALLKDREGDKAAAVAAYRAALLRDDRNALALNNLADALGKDPKTRDEALGLAERAYQTAPRSAMIADTLGWILYQKGTLDRAEQLIAQAASALPGNPEIRYHLGAVYAKRGKKAEARRELEQALKSPSFPAAAEARKALDQLK
ncbi:MAG: tetratricopeptide repeat protein, partial [Candidatus Rokubacteria bacterium]|nr:tetratricopeptide repeat protein [Candidatus Rokubacteria bacterium]